MGMSRSPVVGVVLPLLLGLGGYRLLDALLGVTHKDAKAPIRWQPAFGWMSALWCTVVIVAVFTGIALRSGAIRLGPPRMTTLSLIRLDQQPIYRVPELALIASYYDRLEMTVPQRRALAHSLSDTTIETKTLLSSLQELFANGRTAPAAAPSGYEIFEFHKEEGR